MALTEIAITTLSSEGVLRPASVAAKTEGNFLPYNDGRIIIEAENTATTNKTVTIAQPATIDEVAYPGKVITVTKETTSLIGPFSPSVYNQPGSGQVFVTASSTEVKFRAYYV